MDYNWVKNIDPTKTEIYPIQFANCNRLRENEVVYIFDEVGSGKTISSGLMALDYLHNNEGKKVLIVTTNALINKENPLDGQFLNDWYSKLPFDKLKSKDITAINNDYRNIKKIADRHEEYGLIIIDEAHLFLNKASSRYKNLCQIHSDKVVFLTATPIKNFKSDLKIYIDLAKSIIGKQDVSEQWIEEINTAGKLDESTVICSTFDPEYPVTRYFKDTIKSINKEGYKKVKAKRFLPSIWKYKENEKLSCLIENIQNVYTDNSKSKFVIFTHFIKDAEKIEKYLSKMEEFTEFHDGELSDQKTYKIITGDKNRSELKNFSRKENLPTVLILTYQLAEQGLNLPGFNYVINYHIPAFPSSLEQRFGRIDRMNSEFSEIHMCYLIKDKAPYNSDTLNFYSAIITYINDLISYLPSKNTILSKNMLNEYEQNKDAADEYKKHIQELIHQVPMEYIIQEIEGNHISIHDEKQQELFDFIEEAGIEIDSKTTTKKLWNDIKDQLQVMSSKKAKKVENIIVSYKNLLNLREVTLDDEVDDRIFYKVNQESIYEKDCFLKTIDAVDECGKYISEGESFKSYYEFFSRNIKPLVKIVRDGAVKVIDSEIL